MKTKILLFAMVMLLIHQCGGNEPQNNKTTSVEVTVSDCLNNYDSNAAYDNDMAAPANPDRHYVHYEATGTNVLTLSYEMSINCCDTLEPSVEIKDDTIVIHEEYKNSARYTCNCVCQRNVTISIKDLAYSTYTVIVEGLHPQYRYNENVTFTFDFSATTNADFYYNSENPQTNNLEKPDTITTSSVSDCYSEPKHQLRAEKQARRTDVIHVYATEGGKLNIVHDDVLLNCCTKKNITAERQGNTLIVKEQEWIDQDEEGFAAECDCECYYSLSTAFEGLENGRYTLQISLQPTGFQVIYITEVEIDYTNDLDISFTLDKFSTQYWTLLRSWKLMREVSDFNDVDGTPHASVVDIDMSSRNINYLFDFCVGGYCQRFTIYNGDDVMEEWDFSIIYRGTNMVLEYRAVPDDFGNILPCHFRNPDTIVSLTNDELILHRQLTGCEADEGGETTLYFVPNKPK